MADSSSRAFLDCLIVSILCPKRGLFHARQPGTVAIVGSGRLLPSFPNRLQAFVGWNVLTHWLGWSTMVPVRMMPSCFV